MVVSRVGIIKGQSQYDVMRTWCTEFEIGFQKLGIEVIVYDLKYHTNLMLNHDVDFYLCINGWGLPNLANMTNKPIICYLADHVNDHIGRISALRENLDILTVTDRFDFKILETLGLDNLAYFLPGASLELTYKDIEKSIDILFLGSYSNPSLLLEQLNIRLANQKLLNEKFKEIIKECVSNLDKHYLVDGIEILENSGFSINSNEKDLLLECLHITGRYIYSLERVNLLKGLANAGLVLDIYGNGWEASELYNSKNIRFHKGVNYYESQKLISMSKVFINIQPYQRDGSQERVFAGLGHNAFVISNYTNFLDEELSKYDRIIFYDYKNLEQVIKNVQRVLKYKSFKDEEILDYLSEHHTFQKRAANLIEIFNYNNSLS